MRVFILGCGLYGCHAAMMFKSLNIDFVMADISQEIFSGSSSKNQNRLHLGFHYPRSYKTRKECKEGYGKFIEAYNHSLEEIENNMYLIDNNSTIDFETYKHIYSFENISYKDNQSTSAIPFEYNASMFQGMIRTDEKFINHRKLAEFFKHHLTSHMIPDFDFNKLIMTPTTIEYSNTTYDLLLDCTYFQAPLPLPYSQTHPSFEYELCISLLYKFNSPKSEPLFGFTVMDGGFFSIYPYDPENNIYSLTDVVLTPVLKSMCFDVVRTYKEYLESSPWSIEIIKTKFEDNIKKYIPRFYDYFTYNSFYLSYKTKPRNTSTDDRSLIHVYDQTYPKVHRFCGGKLTGIFTMESILRNLLDSKTSRLEKPSPTYH